MPIDYRLEIIPDAINADQYSIGTISTDELQIVAYRTGSQKHQWVSTGSGGSVGGSTIIKDPITGAVLTPNSSGVVTLPNQDEVLLGIGAPTGTPPAGKEIYFDTVDGKYYVSNGTAWSAGFGGNGALKTRVNQPLVAGDNIITHNFALKSPFATMVSVVDATTKLWIDHALVDIAANSVTVNVGIAVTSAQITILA
jgi:hypothetical protein